MNNYKSILCLVLWMLLNVSCMNYDDNIDNQISENDRTFVLNVIDGGIFEVKAGEIAVEKGDSLILGPMMGPDSLSVRAFGQMMIAEHSKANDELRALSKKHGVSIPNVLSAPKQKQVDSLMVLTGKAFDMAYTKMMVASHQETVSLFQSEAVSGTNSDLKSWAATKLPVLQQHLAAATSMRDAIK